MMRTILLMLLAVVALSITACPSPGRSPSTEPSTTSQNTVAAAPSVVKNRASTPNLEEGRLSLATFAGGCFWCMQPPFDRLEGVRGTVVGYTGGAEAHPSYEEVSGGRTGHAEAVEVLFDPEVITYEELLYVFWRSIDPTTRDRQFADRGRQYRTAIFYHDDQQRELATRSRDELQENGPFDQPIVTEIVPAETFWLAEEYHQQYYLKNPRRYEQYYVGSGRAGFLERTWKNR